MPGCFRGSMLLIESGGLRGAASASGQPVTYSAIYANVPGHTDASATSAEKLIQGRFPLATIQTTKQALAGNQATVQQIEYFLQIVGLLALLDRRGGHRQYDAGAAAPPPHRDRDAQDGWLSAGRPLRDVRA